MWTSKQEGAGRGSRNSSNLCNYHVLYRSFLSQAPTALFGELHCFSSSVEMPANRKPVVKTLDELCQELGCRSMCLRIQGRATHGHTQKPLMRQGELIAGLNQAERAKTVCLHWVRTRTTELPRGRFKDEGFLWSPGLPGALARSCWHS